MVDINLPEEDLVNCEKNTVVNLQSIKLKKPLYELDNIYAF